ncbi:MAG: hypothetical protein L0H84_02015 [Pseudonocardia sp.]|nr:hypothetical protein [Pseudonocardia sp.]
MSHRHPRAVVLAVLALTVLATACAGPVGSAAPEARGEAGCVPGAPKRVAAHVECRTVTVDGFPREFIVYRPAKLTEPAPVVFMFHGSTGTGAQFLRSSGWREEADRRGFIAVFPQGLDYLVLESGRRSSKWNDFSLAAEVDLAKRPAGYPADAPWPADDIGFTRRMIDDLSTAYPVDQGRIYASGFSNGAGFAGRIAVELSDRVAAVAASGGWPTQRHAPVRAILAWLTVGNEDDRMLERLGTPPPATVPMVPAEILTNPVLATFLDAQLATWGLAGPPVATVAPERTTLTWTGGASFRFDVLRGLPHSYPDGADNDAGFVAAAEFWQFFATHAR